MMTTTTAVTEMFVAPPEESRSVIWAVPGLTAPRLRRLSLTPATAIAALLLTAEYEPLPPATVNSWALPTDRVRVAGAVVNSAVCVPGVAPGDPPPPPQAASRTTNSKAAKQEKNRMVNS